jgi:lysophospholipase L1-like esterase
MRLVTFGCSNTYGVGLDSRDDAWPSVLGDHLGLEVINNGIPGASNLEILHNILKYDFKHGDIVIAMWTMVNRDYLFPNTQIGVWQDTELTKKWVAVHDTEDLLMRSWLYIDHANLHLNSKGVLFYNFAVDYGLLKSSKPKHINQKIYNAKVDFHKFIDTAKDGIHPGPKAHKRIANNIKSFINAN